MLKIDFRFGAALTMALALPLTVPAAAHAATSDLYVLDPFLLGASSLKDIDLKTLLPKQSKLSTVAAAALVADNVSAAIALYQTPDDVSVTFTVNEGATLAPYSNDFLESAPSPGKRSL